MLFYNPYTGETVSSDPDPFNEFSNYLLLGLMLTRSFYCFCRNIRVLYQKLKASQDVSGTLRKMLPYFAFLSWASLFLATYISYLFVPPIWAYYGFIECVNIAGPLTMHVNATRVIVNLESQGFIRLFRLSTFLHYALGMISTGVVVISLVIDKRFARYHFIPVLIIQILNVVSHITIHRHIEPLARTGLDGKTNTILRHSSRAAFWTGLATVIGMIHTLCPQFFWLTCFCYAGTEAFDQIALMLTCSLFVSPTRRKSQKNTGEISVNKAARTEARLTSKQITRSETLPT